MCTGRSLLRISRSLLRINRSLLRIRRSLLRIIRALGPDLIVGFEVIINGSWATSPGMLWTARQKISE